MDKNKNITDYKHSPAKRLAMKIKRKRTNIAKMSEEYIVTEAATKYERKYQCPYCDERKEKLKLISHIEKRHPECIPEGYTAARIVFNIINKKQKGTCVICGKESPWNEDKGRYDRFCSDKCKKQYEEIAAERLKRVRGMTKQEMLKDPEYQNNVMLANRKISGKYKFQDGTIRTYVGSYELKFLEFMDKFLNVKSEDLETPGPIIEYKYKGETHKWITDAYYAPYNLVFDIKDGGDNPNNRNMPEYRAKQDAKEAAIKKQGKYNYLRLTDNKFEQLIELMMELKELYIENNGEYTPIVRINESVKEDGEPLDESYIINKIYDEEDDTMLNEGFIFNKKNLYINYNDFKSGKSNVLLVTGLSGSGKTTLGLKLASENNAEFIELDLFEKCYMFDKMEQLKEAGLPFYEYLTRNKNIMEKLKSKSIYGKELEVEIEKFLKWCINFCKKDKKNRYVIEGVQIYSFLNKESLGNTPIVFVNTSVLTSIFRRYKRSYEYDKNDFKNELSELPQCIVWYIDNEKAYRDFKKAVLKESAINEAKAKDLGPKICTKCGSKNIGVFFKGEPIYQCKDCGAYLGVVPFKHESTILNDKGYYKLLDKYKDPKYCGWDEEQTYSTIDLCIRTEKCYGKDMYCYSLDPDTYKITYIGKLHVSELMNDEYSTEWIDKVNEATVIKPCTAKPSQEGFMGRGSWNPIKRVNGEPYRERVEAIIFNKDLTKVLISVDSKGVRIPGGGTMKNKSLESQVIKECQEEVRVNIDNIKYIGEYYLPGKIVKEDDVYKGKYTYVYLATYDSDYNEYIRPEDQSSMINSVKWYDIYEAMDLLKRYNTDIYILFCNEYKEYIASMYRLNQI